MALLIRKNVTPNAAYLFAVVIHAVAIMTIAVFRDVVYVPVLTVAIGIVLTVTVLGYLRVGIAVLLFAKFVVAIV